MLTGAEKCQVHQPGFSSSCCWVVLTAAKPVIVEHAVLAKLDKPILFEFRFHVLVEACSLLPASESKAVRQNQNFIPELAPSAPGRHSFNVGVANLCHTCGCSASSRRVAQLGVWSLATTLLRAQYMKEI